MLSASSNPIQHKANHNGDSFSIPQCLGLWYDKITKAKDATVEALKKTKAIHKARAGDYGIWKAAKDGCKKLTCIVVKEVYINELKDGTTFFHKVNARDLLEHLEKNSTGLHALDSRPAHQHTPPLQKCSQHDGLHPKDGGSQKESEESRTPHLGY